MGEAGGNGVKCNEFRIFCPFCGKELERIDEPISNGDLYICDKCGSVGFGWHEANQTYHVAFAESEDDDCDPSFLGGVEWELGLKPLFGTGVRW